MSFLNNFTMAFSCSDAVISSTASPPEKHRQRTKQEPSLSKRNTLSTTPKMPYPSLEKPYDMERRDSSSIYTAPTISTVHSDLTYQHQSMSDHELRVFCLSDEREGEAQEQEKESCTEEMDCMLTLRRSNPIYDSDDDDDDEYDNNEGDRNRGHTYFYPESMWQRENGNNTTVIEDRHTLLWSDEIISRVVVAK